MIHCDTMIIKFHGPKPPTSKDINQLYNLIILDRMFFFKPRNRSTGRLLPSGRRKRGFRPGAKEFLEVLGSCSRDLVECVVIF